MNIRKKLSLQFTLIFTIILFLASTAVLYFSENYRSQEFYIRLKEKAITTAKLLIEVKEVDRDLLRIIGKNTPTLVHEKVVIYNYLNDEIFDTNEDESIEVNRELLNQIRLEGEVKFVQGDKEVLGLAYTDRYNRFVVVASAHDKYGFSKLQNLKIVLVVVMFSSTLVTLFAGWFYAGEALAPMSKVVSQVDKITASSLNSRLETGNGKDEIASLSETFNKMLERLEAAFEMQRSFVSNASHELRTPLTSITGHLEVILLKSRTTEEYVSVINSVLEDIKSLNRLTNGLLDLAQLNLDSSLVTFKDFRIDELVWQTAAELRKRKAGYKVNVFFDDIPDDETQLILHGNDQLLKVAIINLMDNGCKYSSNNEVNVKLGFFDDGISLNFIDKGIGIDKKELSNIFQPFYRAENAKQIKGHGLGLSLTEKIIAIHKGRMVIHSKLNVGTNVEVFLPLSFKTRQDEFLLAGIKSS
jgi:signal transduction histidine kinase